MSNDDSLFAGHDEQIFAITANNLASFLDEKLKKNSCVCCGEEKTLRAMIDEAGTLAIAQHSLARTPESGVWFFILECINCGFMQNIHTERVRIWLYEPSTAETTLAEQGVEDGV